jgi:hypothetical protein
MAESAQKDLALDGFDQEGERDLGAVSHHSDDWAGWVSRENLRPSIARTVNCRNRLLGVALALGLQHCLCHLLDKQRDAN